MEDADDDFGDFETNLVEPAPADDDFGDFKDPATPEQPVTILPSKPIFCTPETDSEQESFVSGLLRDYVDEYTQIYKEFTLIRTGQTVPPTSDKLWQNLLADESYTLFSWRKSRISRDFTSVFVESQPKPAPVKEKPKQVVVKHVDEQEGDPRETDLVNARRLVDLSEDHVRLKTTQELEEYLAQLKYYQSKMQEQVNYWLDSKERLLMDAEMHNKMIASLVNFAQQQQEPKGKQPKKKK